MREREYTLASDLVRIRAALDLLNQMTGTYSGKTAAVKRLVIVHDALEQSIKRTTNPTLARCPECDNIIVLPKQNN